MFVNVKSLIFILVLAVPAFYVGRQIAIPFVSHREFSLWRNIWFAATVAAFLSGNFFIFAAIATMICLYAQFTSTATIAVYFIILFAVPPVDVPIDGFGIINALFAINNARLLAIILLLPILFRKYGSNRRNIAAYSIPDWLIVSYVLLMIALESRKSDASATQVLRVAVLYTLDVLVPYFAFSRAITSMAEFRAVIMAFVIAVLPLSIIAVFEFAKHWHVYDSLAISWSSRGVSYGHRIDMLRASASAVNPVVFGFVVMVAIGCMIAVRQTIPSRKALGARKFAEVALAILSAGLVASLSRGPWVGTAVLLLAYLATGPNPLVSLGKFAVATGIAVALLLLFPIGQRFLDLLPFIGTIETGNVTYREVLFEQAIKVIENNLLLGSADYMSTTEMQKMIQGEGIIDIVNTYLRVALNSGLIGLSLFIGYFATILIGLRRVLKFNIIRENDLIIYERTSMAILVAILVTITTVSSIEFIPNIYWAFGGLCIALIRIAYSERTAAALAVHRSRIAV